MNQFSRIIAALSETLTEAAEAAFGEDVFVAGMANVGATDPLATWPFRGELVEVVGEVGREGGPVFAVVKDRLAVLEWEVRTPAGIYRGLVLAETREGAMGVVVRDCLGGVGDAEDMVVEEGAPLRRRWLTTNRFYNREDLARADSLGEGNLLAAQRIHASAT